MWNQVQVADVRRPLLSVIAITSKGNTVAFDEAGGVIASQDGKMSLRFQRREGVYVLDLWVPPFAGQGPQ